MKWICTVCGHVHEWHNPPDVCPVCGQPKEMFEKAEETTKENTSAPVPNAGKEGDAAGEREPEAAMAVRKGSLLSRKTVSPGE